MKSSRKLLKNLRIILKEILLILFRRRVIFLLYFLILVVGSWALGITLSGRERKIEVFSQEQSSQTQTFYLKAPEKPEDSQKIPLSEPFYTKGIYISSWTAGDRKRMEELASLVNTTELNAVVIDIKDSSGKIAFDTEIPLADEIGAEELRIPDIKELLAKLRRENIYLIARVVVFQDPVLASKRPDLAVKNRKTGKIWRDFKGLGWVDPASREVWQYNADLAKEAIKLGFNEINFDYIRFPSDGIIGDILYPFWDGKTPKYEVIRSLAKFLNQELKPLNAFLSVDLFGLTLWRGADEGGQTLLYEDLNIGQRVIDFLDNFDFICPMVYPSHYPAGFEGFSNPAKYPYEIVYRSLIKGQRILEGSKTKLRPWLQDFDLGAIYDAKMVQAQKQAAYDASAFGWLLWNASNVYTKEALVPEF